MKMKIILIITMILFASNAEASRRHKIDSTHNTRNNYEFYGNMETPIQFILNDAARQSPVLSNTNSKINISHYTDNRTFDETRYSDSSHILSIASRYLSSRNPTGFRGPWCGAFYAMIARRAGVKVPTNYLQARSWAHIGVKTHAHVGATAVFNHHVTVISQIVPGGFIGVGGNQHHRVKESFFKWSRVIAIRKI